MDGRNIIPVMADSMIVHPGERLDAFIITSNEPKDYNIAFETIGRYNIIFGPISPHYVNGSLLYGEYVPPTDGTGVTESSTLCGVESPCSIFNCDYAEDGTKDVCLTLNDAKSTDAAKLQIPPPVMPDDENFQEYFLDFGTTNSGSVAMINTKRFVWPTSPPAITRKRIAAVTTPCTDTSHAVESCTHTLKVPLGKPVQIVLTNIEPNYNPLTTGWMDHPVHFHGYHFTVLKVGFPKYRADGVVEVQTPDIKCLDEECMVTTWADDTWKGGNIPGLDLENSNLKDTVMVPVGGYVVVRITADNPGYWLIHCHTEKHMSSGMAMILQVGEKREMIRPPPGMPNKCGDFEWDGSFDYLKEDDEDETEDDSMKLDVALPGITTAMASGNVMIIVVVSAANVLILIATLTVAYLMKKRKNDGYRRIDSPVSYKRDENSGLLRP